MKMTLAVVAGLALPLSAYAADLPRRHTLAEIPPAAEASDLFFGSLNVGINLLHAPSQTISPGIGLGVLNAPTVTGGFLTGGGKVTYAPARTIWGGQLDLRVGSINGAWIDPDAGSQNKMLGYGGTAHVFARVTPNAKLGAFVSADWVSLHIQNLRVDLPTFAGGLEGQYEINPNLMVGGRFALGSINAGVNVPLPAGFKIPNLTAMSGGVGLTYALHQNWTVGADLNLTRLSSSFFGVKGRMNVIDLGLNTEYRFASWPVAVRADVGWVSSAVSVSAFGLKPSADAYRAKLTLKYEFGQQPKRLVDREFQNYNILAGMN